MSRALLQLLLEESGEFLVQNQFRHLNKVSRSSSRSRSSVSSTSRSSTTRSLGARTTRTVFTPPTGFTPPSTVDGLDHYYLEGLDVAVSPSSGDSSSVNADLFPFPTSPGTLYVTGSSVESDDSISEDEAQDWRWLYILLFVSFFVLVIFVLLCIHIKRNAQRRASGQAGESAAHNQPPSHANVATGVPAPPSVALQFSEPPEHVALASEGPAVPADSQSTIPQSQPSNSTPARRIAAFHGAREHQDPSPYALYHPGSEPHVLTPAAPAVPASAQYPGFDQLYRPAAAPDHNEPTV